jgi:ribosome biogenesis GTPase A
MKKTKESIKKNLSLVDIVYEIIDARIPYSSRNPDMDELIGNKPRLIIMSKKDLADEKANDQWKKFFIQNNTPSVKVDSLSNDGIEDIVNMSYESTRKKGNKKQAYSSNDSGNT